MRGQNPDGMDDDSYLDFALKGNADAVRLAKQLFQISCIWDDLIDKDKEVRDFQVNEMMWNALLRIPSNPFYREVGHMLRPIMELGIINWHLSDEMAKQSGLPREIAHVARYQAGDVVIYMMSLIGGKDWAIAHGAGLKLRMQRNDFQSYNAEMDALHGTGEKNETAQAPA